MKARIELTPDELAQAVADGLSARYGVRLDTLYVMRGADSAEWDKAIVSLQEVPADSGSVFQARRDQLEKLNEFLGGSCPGTEPVEENGAAPGGEPADVGEAAQGADGD